MLSNKFILIENLCQNSFSPEFGSQMNRNSFNIKQENECNERQTNVSHELSQMDVINGRDVIAIDGTKLRSVQELPPKYQSVFDYFPHFNVVQSKVFDDVLNTDKSIGKSFRIRFILKFMIIFIEI